jgi:hypothetical protein
MSEEWCYKQDGGEDAWTRPFLWGISARQGLRDEDEKRMTVQNERKGVGKGRTGVVRSDAAGLDLVRLRQAGVGRDDSLEVVKAKDGVHVLQR